MTAVAPPPNFQPITRPGWSSGNGSTGGLNAMSPDEVSRMLLPRKSAQRSNSSSSLTSSASSSSTITANSVQTNGASSASANDWSTKKRPARGLWPASKAEPISGISTARPQSIASASSGPTAASAISALHTPSSMLPSQNGAQSQTQTNGAPPAQVQQEDQPILHLTPMNGTFERKTISVPFYPSVVRIGRQTNAKTLPTPMNGYFDSKVLSRSHAEIWSDRNGKIWIRDVKSSNGTFVNGQRLSQENKDSDPHELREQDMLELGIDIVSEDQKTVVHHKVAARVEHAGFWTGGNNVLDLNFGDLNPAASGGLMTSTMGQNVGQLRRTNSQGSLGSNGRLGGAAGAVAGNNMAVMSQQRQQFWLTPVTMDQLVRKVNAEFKQAKVQSMDIQRATHYLENIASSQPKKDSTKISPVGPSKSPFKSDVKARFSDPPAPPPQQPLPEKPDVARPIIDATQPSLRRTDTEKPKLSSANSSPVRMDPSYQMQITSLAEALNNTKRELDTQNLRMRELEERLIQEQRARESAEERAQRLEQERAVHEILTIPRSNGDSKDDEDSVTPIEDTRDDDTAFAKPEVESASTVKLRERLDSVLGEMNEMKQLMEKYRRRAENAEAESARDRQTLAEMVEKIRRDESERESRDAREATRRRRSSSNAIKARSMAMNGTVGTITPNADAEKGAEQRSIAFETDGLPNGNPIHPSMRDPGGQSGSALALTDMSRERLNQLAPLASVSLVVLIGYLSMTVINGWQKPLER